MAKTVYLNMGQFRLNDFEFNEMRIEILNAFAQIELGKFDNNLRSAILQRINYLNTIIDKIVGNKDQQDYLIVDMCYHFYRIKDKLEAIQ